MDLTDNCVFQVLIATMNWVEEMNGSNVIKDRRDALGILS